MNLNYLRFDEPFKIPGKTGFVVPILIGEGSTARERSYRLLQEVKGEVTIEETSRVPVLKFTNGSGYPVLVRKGTILEAKSQPRAPVSSVVLEPTKVPVEVPVNCVYASRALRHGDTFSPVGLAPQSIYMSLGNQGETWNSVEHYSYDVRQRQGMRAAGVSAIRHDDLASTVRLVNKVKDEVDEAIASIPDHVGQVGVAIFSLRGLEGVEVFDSPDTWGALSDSIVKSYRDLWEDEGDLVTINTDAAHARLTRLWEKLARAEMVAGAKTKHSETYRVRVEGYAGEGYVGEAVFLNSVNIHLTLAKEKTDAPKQLIQSPFTGVTNTTSPQSLISVRPWLNYHGRRGTSEVISHLHQAGPTRFNALANTVTVSRPTLSRRLTELSEAGLVGYTIVEGGVPAYALTPEGEALARRKADDPAEEQP